MMNATAMDRREEARHASLNVAGFVKSMPADMKPAPFVVVRYKPAQCAEYGGVRGHGLERRQIKNPKARSEDNPDGLFWEYVIKLTAPCPVVLDDYSNEIARAEAGTVVVVVLDEQIEAAEPYFEVKEWCPEFAFVPVRRGVVKGGMAAKKKDVVLWGFEVGVSGKPMLRSELVPQK